MEAPSPFEVDLLRAALDGKEDRYWSLVAQVPYLRVRKRELTPAGGYVYFDLPAEHSDLVDTESPNVVLTPNKMIETDHPPSGMGFALDVTDGRINFLELFTYGDEEWNGAVGCYRIVST